MEFIVYDNMKHIKAYREILQLVIGLSQKPLFSLDVKIFISTSDLYITMKYIILSFENSGMSDCFITADKNLYDFFAKKYSLSKEAHQNSLINQTNIEMLSNSISECETGGTFCVFKPNPVSAEYRPTYAEACLNGKIKVSVRICFAI